MSRERILGAIRGALDGSPGRDAAAVDARIQAHEANLIPARGQLDAAARVDLFVAMAEEVAATVARVASFADVPGAVADYLTEHNLPAEARLAPDPALDRIPWGDRPLLRLTKGRAEPADAVSVTGAFAAVAETGTLLMASGPDHPSTLKSLPDTHVVVLRRGQVVGDYEEAWRMLRENNKKSGGAMPRTAAFVTGPSRTADIEQTIQLGAHGPRRLHIVLIDGDDGQEG